MRKDKISQEFRDKLDKLNGNIDELEASHYSQFLAIASTISNLHEESLKLLEKEGGCEEAEAIQKALGTAARRIAGFITEHIRQMRSVFETLEES